MRRLLLALSVLAGAEVAAAELPERLRTPDLTCRVRDKRGNLIRSETRRRLFMRLTGFPNGRPGYKGDHVVPLDCGGCDVPSNMQWLTDEEWRRKTRWERKPCSAWWGGDVIRSTGRVGP